MDEAREWLSQSEYDLETAQAMLDSGRYIYAVFMCHMAVEKALKALVVKRTGDAPPRTHNLVQLVGLASPNLTPDEVKFLTRLSSAGVSTRYPEELSKALDDYPPTVVQEYVRRAGEVVECLKKQVS
jgi:HEPN domain-containing protein